MASKAVDNEEREEDGRVRKGTVGMEKAGGRASFLSPARTMNDHRVLQAGLRFG